MRDLDAVDQQLRALGEPPADRAALLDRVLGADRSRDRLEQLLEQLGAGAPVASHASVAPAAADVLAAAHAVAASGGAGQSDGDAQLRDSDLDDRDTDPDGRRTEEMLAVEAAAIVAALSHDTLPDRPSAEEPFDAQEQEESADMSRSTERYEPPPEEQDVAASQPEAPRAGDGFAAMFDFSSPPPPRDDDRTDVTESPWAVAPDLADPLASSARSEAVEDEPTGRRSMPPAPSVVPAATAADDDSDAEEADFELLVEDEEIIEIDDEELQIVDDE
jgi:hypothetical protein